MRLRPAFTVGALGAAVHLAANPHYGFFRDELYFIVCGQSPAWGYADQPPLAPLAAAATQIFGLSLPALRAVPALAAGASAWGAGLLAAELGGGAFAEGFAALLVLLAPLLAAFGTIVGPDGLQMPFWVLAALCVQRAIVRGDARWMLGCGVLLGIAAEAKYTTFLFGGAIALGLLIGGQARLAVSRWAVGGAAAALLIAAPSVMWQWAHGWPFQALIEAGKNGKNVLASPLGFLAEQILLTHPLLAPAWILGLADSARRREARWIAIAGIAVLAAVALVDGKAYYAGALYPVLFAAGAVTLARLTATRRALRPVMAAAALLVSLPLLPQTVPVLPEAQEASYLDAMRRLHLAPAPIEHHAPAALGQIFADMHGWPEIGAAVTRIRDRLPPDLRGRVRVFGANYGEASAAALFGPQDLPRPLSGHNQYWFWGPGDWDGAALIDIGGDLEADRKLCRQAETAAQIHTPWVMPYEDDLPIILCRDLKSPVSAVWPTVKHIE